MGREETLCSLLSVKVLRMVSVSWILYVDTVSITEVETYLSILPTYCNPSYETKVPHILEKCTENFCV